MDDLGSVANVVDSTGTVKNSYRYDPFGNSTSKTEAVSNPWQFASGYLDANTGLYKFGERYYDPALGRWTQKDPVGGSLGNVNSTNPYVYAGNVPNMLVDPTGRDSVSLQGEIGACIGAAVGSALVVALSLFVRIVTAPASVPVGLLVLYTAIIGCIGGLATYGVVKLIGS